MTNFIHHLHRGIVLVLLAALFAASAGTTWAIAHDLVLGTGLVGGHGLVAYSIAAVSHATAAALAGHVRLSLAVLVGVALVSAVLLWAELRWIFRSKPRLILSRGGMGEVAISMDQVGLLAQHEAERIDGVREVQTSAETGKQGLQVQQIIAVEPDRQLPALAEEIQQKVKRSLEYHLGFPVDSVRVALQRASISKALL
jgi:hypothetical protein